MRKKSIAVIINGGIGVGFGNEGVICLTELCECLAVTCDVTVFSLVKVDKDYQPKGYQLYGPPKVLPDKLLFAATYMVLKYIQLHIKRRFDLIHGFWAYPAGALTVIVSLN